jgi:hypothetical protein
METLSSVLKVEYDIQMIYEKLNEYEYIVPKYKIREQYYKYNQKVHNVIIYFLKNKSNILINE